MRWLLTMAMMAAATLMMVQAAEAGGRKGRGASGNTPIHNGNYNWNKPGNNGGKSVGSTNIP